MWKHCLGDNNFAEWNTKSTSLCPDDILAVPQPDKLSYWLSHFVNEVRKQNSNSYPPKGLYQVLAGLQCHMLKTIQTAPKFLDRSSPTFCDLTVYRDLHSQGIGAAVKHTSIFTPEEEERYVYFGALYSLAVFYYVNKHFASEMERTSENLDLFTLLLHLHRTWVKKWSRGLAQLHTENKSGQESKEQSKPSFAKYAEDINFLIASLAILPSILVHNCLHMYKKNLTVWQRN